MDRFANRVTAGRFLGQVLAEKYPQLANGCVLAIPRGGVVVGAEVARILKLPLHALVTKKIGAPGNPEYAIGAVGPDETLILDQTALSLWSKNDIKQSIRDAQAKVRAYLRTFSSGRLPDVRQKTVIVVDDGIATGRTIELALRWLKTQKPARIILAVPVAPPDTLARLQPLVDDAVVLIIPDYLSAIGQFYDDFTPVSDDEVKKLLADLT